MTEQPQRTIDAIVTGTETTLVATGWPRPPEIEIIATGDVRVMMPATVAPCPVGTVARWSTGGPGDGSSWILELDVALPARFAIGLPGEARRGFTVTRSDAPTGPAPAATSPEPSPDPAVLRLADVIRSKIEPLPADLAELGSAPDMKALLAEVHEVAHALEFADVIGALLRSFDNQGILGASRDFALREAISRLSAARQPKRSGLH